MRRPIVIKTKSVMDLINERKNPNYKGKNNKPVETGPLRVNKPLVYNTKKVPNPVIDKTEADKIKGTEVPEKWIPKY